VSGTELTLELCAELRRLAPFGLGNPGVTLLLPSCELRELATVGDGKHLRFRVQGRDNDSGSAIAFGLGTQLDRFRREGRYDVVFRLEENHWNGTVAPQLVVRRVFDAHEGYERLRGWLATQWRLAESDRAPEAAVVFSELGLTGGTRGRRPLLESEAFRAMLEEPELARAA
jgi:single-stranded-DNA-specific exonuclease